jgi:hypothetical protein
MIRKLLRILKNEWTETKLWFIDTFKPIEKDEITRR